MIRTTVLLVCVVHTLAHSVNRGYGDASFGGRGGNGYVSDFGGNTLGGTSTLTKRGVIADPLSNNGYGGISGIGRKSSNLGVQSGGSLLSNDNLFRTPQNVAGSFGSSKGSGQSFGSNKGVGSSFGSSGGYGGSLGSSNGISGSFGSKSNGGSFNSAKSAASSFGSSNGIGNSFGSAKGIGNSFGSSKGIGNSFGSSKDIGNSFGSSKGIDNSFGSAKGFDGYGNGAGNVFSGSGSSIKGGHDSNGANGNDNLLGGNFVQSKDLPSRNVGSVRVNAPGAFSKGDGSYSNNFVNSFNRGYGLEKDGNIFGDHSSILNNGKFSDNRGFVGGIKGSSNTFVGQSGGKGNVWPNSGFVSDGYGQNVQSGGGRSGFDKSNSVTNRGNEFNGKGFSSGGSGKGFSSGVSGKGFSNINNNEGWNYGGGNIIGDKSSFGGVKNGGFSNQGGFGLKGVSISGGGFAKNDGLNNIVSGNGKGINFGNSGPIIGGNGKGFGDNLYSTGNSLSNYGNVNGFSGKGVSSGNNGLVGGGRGGKGFDNGVYSTDDRLNKFNQVGRNDGGLSFGNKGGVVGGGKRFDDGLYSTNDGRGSNYGVDNAYGNEFRGNTGPVGHGVAFPGSSQGYEDGIYY